VLWYECLEDWWGKLMSHQNMVILIVPVEVSMFVLTEMTEIYKILD
jgi:hypothetical protein